ncbi:MAG: 16S rRNA (cytosine(967)-C(5))-methyltransferase RsmB [Gammaproteobacteria bacterium]
MSRNAAPAGAEVRAAAARLVARVLADHVSADEALEDEALEGETGVAPRDRSLLAALVFGALRWHHRLEWQLSRLLSKPLKHDQTELAALLRIGLLQLQELRIPPHAAVSATVDAVALLELRSAAGLVNAVLRRFQRERATLESELQSVPEARFSHPAWLIDALRNDWPDDWTRILDGNNAAAPMWLRVNLRRTTRAAYLETLTAAGLAAEAAADVVTAVRLAVPQPVESLPGFAAGHVSVQDVCAQRAAPLLELAAGQRVLDACAAPGGKTGHILEACADLTEVWAVDRDRARLTRVADNLRRLELTARLITGDATAPAQWWDGRPFDRILLDAPCSAVGVIRRHPDIKVLRRPDDVDGAVALQAKLLRALWPLLAPGGLLVYATCTVLRRENGQQMAAFRGVEPTLGEVTTWQNLPGEAEGDGFYYAGLRKPHALPIPSVFPQP